MRPDSLKWQTIIYLTKYLWEVFHLNYQNISVKDIASCDHNSLSINYQNNSITIISPSLHIFGPPIPKNSLGMFAEH